MIRAIGRSLGADATSYRTPQGIFYIWPYSSGGWLAIWELANSDTEFTIRADTRRDAIGWMEKMLAA